jgi:hypothetical protein
VNHLIENLLIKSETIYLMYYGEIISCIGSFEVTLTDNKIDKISVLLSRYNTNVLKIDITKLINPNKSKNEILVELRKVSLLSLLNRFRHILLKHNLHLTTI